MSNIIERLSKLNLQLEKTMKTFDSSCKDCINYLVTDLSDSLKTSKEDLSVAKSRINELRQGKFCQKDSWSSLEQSITTSIQDLENSCVFSTQVNNSDKISKEFQWKTDQKAKIDKFIQEKKQSLSDNYKQQLRSIK